MEAGRAERMEALRLRMAQEAKDEEEREQGKEKLEVWVGDDEEVSVEVSRSEISRPDFALFTAARSYQDSDGAYRKVSLDVTQSSSPRTSDTDSSRWRRQVLLSQRTIQRYMGGYQAGR
jgi:hypothetical protein